MNDTMKTIYIENDNGIYSAYASKHNQFIVSNKLQEVKIDKDLADLLCRTTEDFNMCQDVMYQMFNDKD